MISICLNTLTGAVTEHDLPFTSISPGYAGSSAGLFAIGDAGPVDARAVLPITDLGSSLRKRLGDVLVSAQGPRATRGTLVVQLMTLDDQDQEVREEYTYDFPIRPGHVSRAVPGKGIHANRLALGFANADGADFRLKGLEPDIIESKSRHLG